MWLPEAKVKRFILIALTKEISKKQNRDFVFWISLMKSVLNKCSKLRKKKNIKYVASNKRVPGSEMELNPKRLREWYSQGKIPTAKFRPRHGGANL